MVRCLSTKSMVLRDSKSLKYKQYIDASFIRLNSKAVFSGNKSLLLDTVKRLVSILLLPQTLDLWAGITFISYAMSNLVSIQILDSQVSIFDFMPCILRVVYQFICLQNVLVLVFACVSVLTITLQTSSRIFYRQFWEWTVAEADSRSQRGH